MAGEKSSSDRFLDYVASGREKSFFFFDEAHKFILEFWLKKRVKIMSDLPWQSGLLLCRRVRRKWQNWQIRRHWPVRNGQQ